MKTQIIQGLIQYSLENEKSPANVFQLSKFLSITEQEFYQHFSSIDAAEEAVLTHYWMDAFQTLTADSTFLGFSLKEKLISLHFGWVEKLLSIRSYLQWKMKDWKNPMSSLTLLKSLRSQVLNDLESLFKMAQQNNEIPDRKFLDKLSNEAVWLNTAFILHFWLNDSSREFEKTDACIEKSIGLTMDLIGRNTLDQAIDFGKFLFQQSK
ncbi:MAG: hypothetical protein RLZZ252_1879 [Bacteroidota bacterium]|jgi:hypothetical protein